jgi:hypothetical protein
MLHDYQVLGRIDRKENRSHSRPWAGNPLGYVIDGTLAVPGTFRHHYIGEKAVALMDGRGILAEVGGGGGDVGFFALRFPSVHYVDMDLPEILLLASYWLCSTLPDRKIVLYGTRPQDSARQHREARRDPGWELLLPSAAKKGFPWMFS